MPGRSRSSTPCASALPTVTSRAPSAASAPYGNCVGVPNVGGEVVFDDVYASNCLVNAMCVGLLPADTVIVDAERPAGALSCSTAPPGPDGIGGASVLASQALGEEAADERASVQVGDPFRTGKRLIEVSVELVESWARALAPGLRRRQTRRRCRRWRPTTGSTSISTTCRRRRDEPWEVMISESQRPDGGDRRSRPGRGRGGDRPLGELFTAPGRDRRGDRDRGVAGTLADESVAPFPAASCELPRYAVEYIPRRPSAEVPLTELPAPPRSCSG